MKSKEGHEASSAEIRFSLQARETPDMPLEETTFNAYRDIFQRLQGKEGNLVRIWNYIPHILDDQGNLERYRKFNIGRNKAWQQYGPKTQSGELLFPAATGIGSSEDNLRIDVMFSSNPVIYLQNPRQIPPAQYSQKYGPKPPVFARGAILQKPNRTEFYISGTASILGEDVVHIGDPAAQTEESIRNIQVLISEENCKQYGFEGGFMLSDLEVIRVFYKNSEELPAIQAVVEKYVPIPITYEHSDICRRDLLVEIEGMCEDEVKFHNRPSHIDKDCV